MTSSFSLLISSYDFELSQLPRTTVDSIVMANRRTHEVSNTIGHGNFKQSQGIPRVGLKRQNTGSSGRMKSYTQSSKSNISTHSSSNNQRVRQANRATVQLAVKSEDTDFLYSIAEEPAESQLFASELSQRKQRRKDVHGGHLKVSAREIRWLEEETERARWRHRKQIEKEAKKRESEPGYWLALAKDIAARGYLAY